MGLASVQQASLHGTLNGTQGTGTLSGENENGPTALAGEVWSLRVHMSLDSPRGKEEFLHLLG